MIQYIMTLLMSQLQKAVEFYMGRMYFKLTTNWSPMTRQCSLVLQQWKHFYHRMRQLELRRLLS